MSLAVGTTDVDICARACVLLGVSPISSLGDGSDKSSSLSIIYPMVRDEMLSIYQWNFTMAKAQLARLTATPINEWTYAFQLPTNRLGGPQAVYNTNAVGATPIKDFDIFEDKLYSDQTSIYIDYQAVMDETKFPPYFTTLLSYAVASRSAEALTDDTSKMDRWHTVAFGTPGEDGQGGFFRTCRYLDSRTTPPDTFTDYTLIDVRNS